MTHYGDLSGFRAYATAKGDSGPAEATDADATAALVRGSAALDALYFGRFPGVKTGGREQELAWPRMKPDGDPLHDAEGNEIPTDEVPPEIEKAAYELALRELADPGSTAPDMDRGGKIKEIRAGSVGITYADTAPTETVFQLVDGILALLLGARPGKTYVGMVMRA